MTVRALIIAVTLAMASPAAAEVVETTRGLDVYSKPAKSSRHSRGRVLSKARFEVLERARGKGCKADWIRIADRAWICARHTRATDEPAGGPEQPTLEKGKQLPHTYVVTRDATAYPTLDDAVAGKRGVTLPGQGGYKYRGTRSRGGSRFVRTDEGWIAADEATIVNEIDFRGQTLGAGAVGQPLAFVRARDARVHDARGVRTGDRIDAQTWLGPVGNTVEVGKRSIIDVGKGRYLDRRDVAVLSWPAPPKVAADERWIDVDLSEQVLVAYQGTTPIFATLVSTARTTTPVGEFRIEKKRPYSRMRSKPHFRTKWDTYTPWVISIKGRIAIHAVYWHEEFGKARSMGCVNVSPRDAKFLWDFTYPALPAGWVRIEADEKDQPTLVRIRRSRDR